MTTRQHALFEELGLMAEEPQQNPLMVLGINPPFAHNLLREDAKGETLAMMATGLYRILSKRYHPDSGATADDNRFGEIEDARRRIEKASPATLLRWAKTETGATSQRNNKILEQRDSVVAAATELVRANIELGQHPRHVAQFGASQGIIAVRKSTTLLVRQPASRAGIEILRGEASYLNKDQPMAGTMGAFDFQRFLKQNGAFGLEPGRKISVFLNGEGRATILNSNLDFVMDVTHPVQKYRNRRKPRKPRFPLQNTQEDGSDESDIWARTSNAVMLATEIPRDDLDTPPTQVTFFSAKHKTHPAWVLPMEIGGSIQDNELFNRLRFQKALGAQAIAGAAVEQGSNKFGMFGLPTRQLIEHKAGVSPLIQAGNSLLLYDTTSRLPVITDATIIGMLGNGAQR